MSNDNNAAVTLKRRGLYKSSNSPLLTVAEAMELTGVCRHTLFRMEKGRAPKLHPVKIRGCKYYLKSEIYALVNPDKIQS
jgi:predicted DNA-binding transcriptional regulator AlpA